MSKKKKNRQQNSIDRSPKPSEHEQVKEKLSEKKIYTANILDYEFDTDYTGEDPKLIKDELDLFFDGQEKAKTEKIKDERYETDAKFSVVTSAYGKYELENLWIQRNDLLRQKIAENEKHLLFIRKKISNLTFSINFHIALFIVCLAIDLYIWVMKDAIWAAFLPTYIGVSMVITWVLSFYNVFATAKSIRMYRYHVKKDLGWTKPHPVDKNSRKRPARERNYKAEYEKVNWVLRQYDYEKELMFVIKMHIDSGEINDIEELKRQLHDVFIYEDVEPAMR